MLSGLKQAFTGCGNIKALGSDTDVTLFVLMITIPTVIIFSILNAFYGQFLLSGLEIVIAMILYPFLFFGRKGILLPCFDYVPVAAAFITFIFLFASGGIGNLGIYWTLIFPFLAFLLMGIKQGWYWIGLFVLTLSLFYGLDHFDLITLPYEQVTLSFAPLMFVFFTLVANVFELQNEKQRVWLHKINTELKNKEDALRISYANLENKVFQRTSELQEINTQLVQEMKQKEQAIASMKQTEMKFQHAQRMESVGTLVGGIAHDFNNMLSGITANLYMAERQMASEDGKKRLSKIGDLSMHAADMIKQLLTFARKDSVEMKTFDLHVFLNEAFKLACVSIPENIVCSQDFSKGEMFIKGNATQIQQILMNLMNNAKDAIKSAHQAKIHVSLSVMTADQGFCARLPNATEGNYVLLSVQDNGMGISNQQLDNIFEPFFTTKDVGKGTGLGLAMVYGAMQSHDGLIDVESAVGHGTTFKLYFPLLLDKQAEHVDNISFEKVVEGHGESILLADDDPGLCECHSALLQGMGYQVHIAHDGLEAFKLYQKHDFDLVL
ncbi:MAG: ATP-binding protein, partial [Mariprofundus sp.]|nr:ATP-binding protein [Mariprofundus sp.]